MKGGVSASGKDPHGMGQDKGFIVTRLPVFDIQRRITRTEDDGDSAHIRSGKAIDEDSFGLPETCVLLAIFGVLFGFKQS